MIQHGPGALACVLAILLCTAAKSAPYINPEDDHRHFGDVNKPLFWTPEQKVAGFRNAYQLYPVRRIARGPTTLPLPSQLQDISQLAINSGSGAITLEDYIEQRDVAGILVIRDGKVLFERYALGNDENTLWLSWSVAKSLSSLLVGAAIHDGYIASVNEKVTDYLPRLKGSAYEQVSLKNLLQMSSGVSWDEDYADPGSDINRIDWPTLQAFDYLRQLPVAAPPGSRFQYNTAETNLVGDLLRAAIGNNLATYASEKIWIPLGMGSDAYWELTEPGGGEYGGSSFNATLRDYGRLGLFVLGEGQLTGGARVLPESWIAESTRGADAYAGYGYLWWLKDGGKFQAVGVFGQAIFIDPQQKLVIALHSAWPVAHSRDYAEARDRMFEAISNAVDAN